MARPPSTTIRDLVGRIVGVCTDTGHYNYPRFGRTLDEAWADLRSSIQNMRKKLGETRTEQLLDMCGQAQQHFLAGYSRMVVQGDVQETQCGQCGAVGTAFTLTGDTDMAADGLGAAACGNRKLALGTLTPEELRSGDLGLEDFAERAAQLLGDDFRSIIVKRYEGGSAPKTASFAEFRRGYRKPERVYLCRVCGGDAVATRSLSLRDFESEGGSIHLLGDVSIARES